eukprot:gnl/Spiro4/22687_TR11198_c0_g1_i1.p1 gnl/Spiro4/22687_TR11198_c0_g1~~gnl/Spiro4/22687_TR11198_c0_g1_i1.p1  ORF type:complete len:663 (+),score=148.12 gnl/Spiro4/22687_TR11198_c0_g1_i1:43-2031(+)
MRSLSHCSFFLLLFLAGSFVLADVDSPTDDLLPIYNLIYTGLNPAFCTRLMNSTHRIGCTTPYGGARGRLVFMNRGYDESFVQKLISDFKTTSYLLVTYPPLSNVTLLRRLSEQSSLAGVILLFDGIAPPSSGCSSGEVTSPQAPWLEPNLPAFNWNPWGTGILYEEFSFPIVQLDSAESAVVLGRAQSNSALNSYFWTAELDAYMQASRDSRRCLQENTCQPLGGDSVFGVLGTGGADPSVVTNRPVVLVTTAADSNSLFHDLAVGTRAEKSGLLVMLAVARALADLFASQPQVWTAYPYNVAFAALDNEAWGLSGSQAFASALSTCRSHGCKDLPANMQALAGSDLVAAVDLRSVARPLASAPPTPTATFAAHCSCSRPPPSQLLAAFQEPNSPVQLVQATKPGSTRALPPSAVPALLSVSSSAQALVITDHIDEFTNPFYHSELDNQLSSLNISAMCALSGLIARSVIRFGLPNTSPVVQVNCSWIAELANALVPNLANLSFSDTSSTRTAPLSLYTSVFDTGAGFYILDKLANAIAQPSTAKCSKSSDCGENRRCLEVGVCSQGRDPTFTLSAKDPGVRWNSDSYRWDIVNASRPLWTESNWNYLSMRMYREASRLSEYMTFLGGAIALIVEVFIVWGIARVGEASWTAANRRTTHGD